MGITAGSKTTIQIEGKEIEAIITLVENDEYVVIYEIDGRIEFEIIKIE